MSYVQGKTIVELLPIELELKLHALQTRGALQGLRYAKVITNFVVRKG